MLSLYRGNRAYASGLDPETVHQIDIGETFEFTNRVSAPGQTP
jgi:hypothetical protein